MSLSKVCLTACYSAWPKYGIAPILQKSKIADKPIQLPIPLPRNKTMPRVSVVLLQRQVQQASCTN